MKNFVNKYLTVIIGTVAVLVLIGAFVVATTLGGNTSNPTEGSTEIENSSATEPSSTESESVIPSETETESESAPDTESETAGPTEGTDPSDDETENSSEGTTEIPSDEPIDTPHIHKYEESIKPATCTEDGERAFVCECGDIRIEKIKATGHSFGAYTYNNDATHTKDGTKTATCANCGAKDTKTATGTKLAYTYTDMNKTMWATSSVNVRSLPSTEGSKLGKLAADEKVTVTGKCNENGWYRISYKGKDGYVSSNYLTETEPVVVDDEPAISNGKVPAGTYSVNGYEIRIEDEMYAVTYEFYKKLCYAGPYEIVYREDTGDYYMLIENPDDGFNYRQKIREYIIEHGGTPGNGGGCYSPVWVPGADYPLYQVYVHVRQL